jgi:protein-S-isoprenylcysteine O-methyltransferase Ste14
MLDAVPLAALVAIFAASLIRGEAIRRSGGDRAWAFAEARGKQRLAGLAFGLSILVSAGSALQAVLAGAPHYSLAGALIATSGALIVIAAQIQMGRAWRVGVRPGDAPQFIIDGLFRFSRNPIFVGMMLIGLAVALTAGTWWSWAALGAFVVACAVQVGIEEGHLEASFGEPYRSYRRQVPRWIGLPNNSPSTISR